MHRDAEQAAATDVFMFFMFVSCDECAEMRSNGDQAAQIYVLVFFYVCLCLCVFCVLRFFGDKCEEMGSNGDQAAQMDQLKKVGVGAPTRAL